MIVIAVFVTFVGICLGSFVNALVWRTRQQELLTEKSEGKKLTKAERAQLAKLSITKGRSMCTHCGHELAAKDLVPVLSYLWLRGKCRYCGKRIEDTPVAEVTLGAAALLSYSFWPFALSGFMGGAVFGVWLVVITILLALALYDARWYILPNRLVAALSVAAVLLAASIGIEQGSWTPILDAFWGGLAIAGLFYLLHQLSGGRWIGGGDVRIAFALGLISGSLTGAFLLIFAASLLGTLYAFVVSLATKKPLTGATRVPFGPFLIIAAFVVFLFGAGVVEWYRDLLLGL